MAFVLELLPMNRETEEFVHSTDNTTRRVIAFSTARHGLSIEPARTRGPTNTPPPNLEDEKETRAWLRIGLDQPQKRPSRSFATFGRSKDCCDIVIDMQEVSYQHCHLEYEPSHKILFLRDTSSNGTLFKDFRQGEEEPLWRKYQRRPLLALAEMKLLTACIKIGPAKFALRKAVNAGTPAHTALLRRFDEYARNRLTDLALTELKMDVGSYRPTKVPTPGGDILLAPGDTEFKRIKTLGSGSFGTVYKVLDMHTGIYYAQKAIRFLKDDRWTELLRREILNMSKVSHEHIVEFVGFQQGISNDSEVCFLMVLYSDDLKSILPRPSIGPVLCKQLLQAVAFLHENGIVHRDIKPSNILLQCVNPLHIRLADLGLSKIIEDTTETVVGTGRYMAPEITGHKYTNKVDVYSVGITVYEALGGLMPLTSSVTTFQKVVQKQLLERFVATEAYHLLCKMLCIDPNQRLTAAACLSDSYITTSPSTVARFQAVLGMNASEEHELKIALNRRKKANLPFEQRLLARQGIPDNGLVHGGKVMKKANWQRNRTKPPQGL